MADSIDGAVRGGRAAFFADPDTDRLLAMLMRMVTEHWALRERVLTLEALLTERGIIDAETIATYRPTPETDAAWDAESYALMQAIIEAAQNIERKDP